MRVDDARREAVIAIVVPKPGAALDEAALIASLKGRIANYKVPKRVVFGTLPKTSSGKLQRARCRELYLDEALELA